MTKRLAVQNMHNNQTHWVPLPSLLGQLLHLIQTPRYLDLWVGQCIDVQKHDWLLALIYMKGLRNDFHHLDKREEPGKKQDHVLIITKQVSKL